MVSGSCTVYGSFPTTRLSANGIVVSLISSYYTAAFEGISPTSSFILTMRYPGDYGEPSGATPGNCNINVSWTFPAPQPTEISGPTELEKDQTGELDGTVTYASNYTWTTTDNCSFVGFTDLATVTVKGDTVGTCIIIREACNNDDECVMDTHNISIVGPTYMVPIRYRLLD